ncbi:MAG: hypothetical protein ABIE75_02060, partial [Candidatus Omnitrophota bacterium]
MGFNTIVHSDDGSTMALFHFANHSDSSRKKAKKVYVTAAAWLGSDGLPVAPAVMISVPSRIRNLRTGKNIKGAVPNVMHFTAPERLFKEGDGYILQGYGGKDDTWVEYRSIKITKDTLRKMLPKETPSVSSPMWVKDGSGESFLYDAYPKGCGEQAWSVACAIWGLKTLSASSPVSKFYDSLFIFTVPLWEKFSRCDPRDPKSVYEFHEMQNDLNTGSRVVCYGNEYNLTEAIKRIWDIVKDDEVFKTDIKTAVRNLSENVRQHAQDYGLLFANVLGLDDLELVVMDVGQKGFNPDSHGVPIIHILDEIGFLPRPYRDTSFRGVSLKQAYDISNDFIILSLGHAWRKDHPITERERRIKGIRGTMITLTIKSRSGSPVAKARGVIEEASSWLGKKSLGNWRRAQVLKPLIEQLDNIAKVDLPEEMFRAIENFGAEIEKNTGLNKAIRLSLIKRLNFARKKLESHRSSSPVDVAIIYGAHRYTEDFNAGWTVLKKVFTEAFSARKKVIYLQEDFGPTIDFLEQFGVYYQGEPITISQSLKDNIRSKYKKVTTANRKMFLNLMRKESFVNLARSGIFNVSEDNIFMSELFRMVRENKVRFKFEDLIFDNWLLFTLGNLEHSSIFNSLGKEGLNINNFMQGMKESFDKLIVGIKARDSDLRKQILHLLNSERNACVITYRGIAHYGMEKELETIGIDVEI